jgi:hypothetical protein
MPDLIMLDAENEKPETVPTIRQFIHNNDMRIGPEY